ncbi:MAG: glycosyltransferase family 4 protein [Planctomycetota bacterium]|jgi:alpha-1,3-rhamnosyl/mannosyltransferase
MPDHKISVILNDRALINPKTGVGHYITELIRSLSQTHPHIDLLPVYQTYFARKPRRPAEIPPSSAPGPARRWPWWLRRLAQGTYNQTFKTIARLKGCNLYHEPNHIPLPWKGTTITTIHDLSVLRNPDWHPLDRVKWYQQDLVPSLPRSKHFITVSEFTKTEMVDLLGIDPQKITPIALGARYIFHPRPKEQITEWLKRKHLPTDYLLYVGTMEPRKNLPGTLSAYAQLPNTLQQNHPLLIVGAAGWQTESTQSLIDRYRLKDQVRILGYMDDEDLAYLYAGASTLVWPTFYEGFGLPPLECMASGTPVISSNLSSIPEVVGDASILVNPHDNSQIAQAIQKVLEDPQLAQTLAEKGQARSKMFSWKKCAEQHAILYQKFSTD